MGVNLTKGANAPVGNVQKFTVGLGWDMNRADSGGTFDLDASAFLLDASGKVLSDRHFVFFNNRQSPEGGVVSGGDNLTGAGDGDDETIQIDLSKVPANCESISFIVTIHEAESRRQNFGQIRNAYVRILDPGTREEIVKYDLAEDFSIETAIEFGSLYKRNDQWKFRAVGSGYAGGLMKFCEIYGVNIG
ncbi:MAG: TerD family protein [Bacteroidia bacterium]